METQGQPRQPGLSPTWAYRQRGFSNLLRMGHCAPTVMQTLLDVSPTDGPTQGEWLVRLSAGMPGGIGNTGHECGAVTSPLALMGVQGSLGEMDRGLPVLAGTAYGIATAVLPLLVLFPSMGYGWLGLRTGDAARLNRIMVLGHVAFGVGIGLWAPRFAERRPRS